MSIDFAVKLLGPGSRCARPGHESWRAHDACEGAARKANRWPLSQTYDVKQRSLLRSRGAFMRPGSSVLFAPACPRLRCRGRRNLGGNPGSSNPIAPRMRGGWSADRRTLLLRRACEARPPCPGATGTPLGAPSWRFSAGDPRRQLRQWHRICAAACPRRAQSPAGRDPGPPAVRFAPPPRDATPCSVLRIVSGRRPS
jgi:hypothetical protein